jgi:hypothetical protein
MHATAPGLVGLRASPEYRALTLSTDGFRAMEAIMPLEIVTLLAVMAVFAAEVTWIVRA